MQNLLTRISDLTADDYGALTVIVSAAAIIVVSVLMQVLYINPHDPRFTNHRLIVYSFRLFLSSSAVAGFWSMADALDVISGAQAPFHHPSVLLFSSVGGLMMTAFVFHISNVKRYKRH